jgi:type II secretory pathway component GspD/PulD (secretin)
MWRRDSSRNSPVDRFGRSTDSGIDGEETIVDQITETLTGGGSGNVDPLAGGGSGSGGTNGNSKSITRTISKVLSPDRLPADLAAANFPVATNGKGLNWAFGDVVSIFGQSFNLAAQIQALEDRNLVEILANPRVVTLINIQAKISIIQKIPYTEAVTGVSGATTTEVEFDDAGVEISVTPIITANGFVRMNLTTSQKIFRGRVGQGPLDPPLIDNRDANTNVIVKGGDTVMIGGLRELRGQESSSQVPWFGQIPVFGWLFKNKQNGDTKTELVLFVTPSIIEQPALTTEEKGWYDRIETKWHLPDYFFDDVKTPMDKK